ncbi:hypothetical protein F2Q68_00034325 [Brassica cretica]|uniref:Uncharacterized protein n=1 Tax=Brassica cretica TaxID=69181 RepID=A0A8S9H9R0_BRACR|nr:hypothetical protein F2Q68_00034325 [Brassica cretica]
MLCLHRLNTSSHGDRIFFLRCPNAEVGLVRSYLTHGTCQRRHRTSTVAGDFSGKPPPSPSSPPVADTGDSPATRQLGRVDPIWSPFEQLEFIDTTSYCCQGEGYSVKSRASLVLPLRKGTETFVLGHLCLWIAGAHDVCAYDAYDCGDGGGTKTFLLTTLEMAGHLIPHWAIPLSLTPPSFPFQVKPMSRSDYTGPKELVKNYSLVLATVTGDGRGPSNVSDVLERDCTHQQEFELPEIVAGATSPTERASLATTDNRPRPPSCSSRRDEAIDTNHAAIGARTSPHAPPEDHPSRARETQSPPSPPSPRRSRRSRPPSVRRRTSAVASDFSGKPPPSPPVTDTGDSPATRQLGRVDPVNRMVLLKLISVKENRLVRGICTRPRDLRGTETFVLGRVIAGAHDVCDSYALFERSRGTEISVLGRVFSGHLIPHWTIPLSLTPPSFPFQVRPTSRSDYQTCAIGLLGFYYYRALDFYHF